MWKIEKNLNDDRVVLSVSGRMQADLLRELERLLAAGVDHNNHVLDLANVRLADYEAVRFLADCEARGVELQNCPPYIREWIGRERDNA
jgi:hypothetical protein